MKRLLARMPLGWRVFAATSITITLLFAAAGWGLQQYAISVADESVRSEIRASIQAYEAVWKSRTQVLSATSALMGGMSDVRAAFLTRDANTIRDSAQELWGRVSDASAVFLVLDAEGHLISSLGKDSGELPVSAIPLRQAAWRFPRQLAGYLQTGETLFYVVLTPVYVQTSGDPVLLNVLCSGFRIDNLVAGELKELGPRSDFVFLGQHAIFASTFDASLSQALFQSVLGQETAASERFSRSFIIAHQPLNDMLGQPVAELYVVRSYAKELESLSRLRRSLGLAWLLTIVVALLLSSYAMSRLLRPVKLLDRAAAEVAAGNYWYRVPVQGNSELSRLAATFNQMCQSIEQARAELIRQEQIHTIGRLGSSLVHDLRNPLAAIYGGAELLVDGNLPADHTRRVAMNIHRACERVQQLLRDLLNVSRGQELDADFCRLSEIVGAAADSVDTETTQVRINTKIDETLEVFGERTRIERVFTNLLSNAVEAMPGGGAIHIDASEDARGVSVIVEDTGPGIPPQIQTEVFKPFVTGKRSGLGLGLALSRQTMTELGGGLSAIEPRRGGGACFCVFFSKTRKTEFPAL